MLRKCLQHKITCLQSEICFIHYKILSHEKQTCCRNVSATGFWLKKTMTKTFVQHSYFCIKPVATELRTKFAKTCSQHMT